MPERDFAGEFVSPGGFVFGVQGWTWGEQKPSAITFFLDGTAKVSDQHGRPIKGAVRDNKPIYFDRCSHAELVETLAAERVDWEKLSIAGWPQLPYDQLRKLGPWFNTFLQSTMTADTRPTYLNELRKIKDKGLRQDAMRLWHEVDSERAREMATSDEEEQSSPGGSEGQPPQSTTAIQRTGHPRPIS